MSARSAVIATTLAVVTAVLGWVLFVGLPRWDRARQAEAPVPPPETAPAAPARKIKATLFYVAADGGRLSGVEREVAFGEGTAAQAEAIINAQIAPVVEPLVSAVPPGTTLRALYVTTRGEAFVDLSPEVSAAHPGGSLDELLTIYTIVNALTANLPAVTAVQVMVGGKEVETLAGHIDLRRPLAKNLAWVE